MMSWPARSIGEAGAFREKLVLRLLSIDIQLVTGVVRLAHDVAQPPRRAKC